MVENAQPALKSVPLGIKQKSILATCNYIARGRGVKKLQLISEAKKVCPDLVLADGEDLSRFRDVSKKLYGLLRSYSWNKKAERLGLDEIFLDVTDIVAYNVELLNRNTLTNSFLCLSREDPELGISFDASAPAGCVTGDNHQTNHDDPLYIKLVVASHLAQYLRLKIEEEGYTSACGISTNKLLSKMVGSVNKPRNQTTLLSLHHDQVITFMDSHGLRKVPGVGGKITYTLETFFLGREADTDTYTNGSAVKVGQLRNHPNIYPPTLEKLLGNRPGSEKGIGEKIWALLHGVDDTEVKAASSIPTQISIEDTYSGSRGGLNTVVEVERELSKITASLLRRMHVDLTEDDAFAPHASANSLTGRLGSEAQNHQKQKRWLAHPKTIRLSTRPKTSITDGKPYNWGRSSRSQSFPTFVFMSDDDNETTVARLVKETILPMFFKLNPGSGEWNIGLVNICAANMVLTATEGNATSSGRDISHMFRRQEGILREFKVYNEDDTPISQGITEAIQPPDFPSPSEDEEEVVDVDFYAASESWNAEDGSQPCNICRHYIPPFAMSAHKRYHDLGDYQLL